MTVILGSVRRLVKVFVRVRPKEKKIFDIVFIVTNWVKDIILLKKFSRNYVASDFSFNSLIYFVLSSKRSINLLVCQNIFGLLRDQGPFFLFIFNLLLFTVIFTQINSFNTFVFNCVFLNTWVFNCIFNWVFNWVFYLFFLSNFFLSFVFILFVA